MGFYQLQGHRGVMASSCTQRVAKHPPAAFPRPPRPGMLCGGNSMDGVNPAGAGTHTPPARTPCWELLGLLVFPRSLRLGGVRGTWTAGPQPGGGHMNRGGSPRKAGHGGFGGMPAPEPGWDQDGVGGVPTAASCPLPAGAG